MRPCDSLFSAFHLLPQEVRRRFRGLLLRAAYGCVLVAAEQHHRAYRIPGADYRGYRRRGKGLRPVRSNVRRRTAVRPNAQPAELLFGRLFSSFYFRLSTSCSV